MVDRFLGPGLAWVAPSLGTLGRAGGGVPDMLTGGSVGWGQGGLSSHLHPILTSGILRLQRKRAKGMLSASPPPWAAPMRNIGGLGEILPYPARMFKAIGASDGLFCFPCERTKHHGTGHLGKWRDFHCPPV